jgi:hypothetical protein
MTADTRSGATAIPTDYGRFCWNVSAGTLAWSDSIYHLHGYRPHQTVPSVALAFGHTHRDDLHGCVDALHAGMVSDRLVVHEHRLLTAKGEVRPAVLIARPVNREGTTGQMHGFLLPTSDNGAADDATTAVYVDPILPSLMEAFRIGEPAARVLLAARCPLTLRRTPEQQALARGYADPSPGRDLRRTLEAGMFPLEHLALNGMELAA